MVFWFTFNDTHMLFTCLLSVILCHHFWWAQSPNRHPEWLHHRGKKNSGRKDLESDRDENKNYWQRKRSNCFPLLLLGKSWEETKGLFIVLLRSTRKSNLLKKDRKCLWLCISVEYVKAHAITTPSSPSHQQSLLEYKDTSCCLGEKIDPHFTTASL